MNVAFLSDGSSDRLLLPPLQWLLHEVEPSSKHVVTPIDLGLLVGPPKGLSDRIALVCTRGKWDLVLVHRDAEGQGRQKRIDEIDAGETGAIAKCAAGRVPKIVPVVPVRMTEAWLLFDEGAIREAAGSKRSTVSLELPSLSVIESKPNPKALLHEALKRASGKSGRHLRKFNVEERCYRIGDYVGDWSPLDALESFSALRADLSRALAHD